MSEDSSECQGAYVPISKMKKKDEKGKLKFVIFFKVRTHLVDNYSSPLFSMSLV